jgi:hypothetical protein
MIEIEEVQGEEPIRYTIHDVRAKARNLVVEWQKRVGEGNSIDYLAGLVLEQAITDSLISMCTIEQREDG